MSSRFSSRTILFDTSVHIITIISVSANLIHTFIDLVKTFLSLLPHPGLNRLGLSLKDRINSLDRARSRFEVCRSRGRKSQRLFGNYYQFMNVKYNSTLYTDLHCCFKSAFIYKSRNTFHSPLEVIHRRD